MARGSTWYSAVLCRLRNVSMKDGSRSVLGPLDAEIDASGLHILMGANGAGKSLLLRLMQGLTEPTEGHVLWDGSPPDTSRAARSFVFQSPPLLRRSVARNVAFPLQAQGSVDWSRVSAALAEAGLAEAAHLPAARLSGGERQRMAMARALVTDPKVLLLDEPSASLDPNATQLLEAMIQKAMAQGIGVILSTHNIAQARRLGGDVIFLDGGRICEQGATRSFLAAPQSAKGIAFLEGHI